MFDIRYNPDYIIIEPITTQSKNVFEIHRVNYSHTSLPRSSTVAFMPPLMLLLPDLPNCSAIRTFSSPRLCFSNVASLWPSASAFSTFCLSRFWTFCRWRLVSGSETFEACDDD